MRQSARAHEIGEIGDSCAAVGRDFRLTQTVLQRDAFGVVDLEREQVCCGVQKQRRVSR